jgi:L-seryl-tRNA(Ser) seleniumtransferase
MAIYEELGVKKAINAWGTITKIGGSLMAPEVLQAMCEAAGAYVDMYELHEKAGERIASLIGVEGAYVTCGAAAAIAIATAACMAGEDPADIIKLPDSGGMPDEILVLKCHRSRYDQGLRMAGGRMVEIGLADFAIIEQVEAAITEKTAMFFYLAESEKLRGSIPLRKIAAVLKKRGIPLVVDAAAEVPPLENLTRFITEGADLVIFSGGKEIRGPQASGLILGNKKLIRACAANSCPNHGVGRAMKVDKESIAGLVKAVELFVNRDFKKVEEGWESIVAAFLDGLSGVAGLSARRGFPLEPGVQPVTVPRVYIKSSKIDAPSLVDALRQGNPPIYADRQADELVINPQNIEDGETGLIIERLVKLC